jgi:RNA polymerase sigma-54 factor
MKQGMHQTTSLRQELRMNPRLYQAMDLLYMPLIDLQQHLKQELLVNPFLELIEPEDDELPAEQPEPEPPEEKKEEETDWEEIILDGFQVSGSGARDLSESDEVFERTPVQGRALTDHLWDQLLMLELTERQRTLADEFLGNLGDDGYLQASLEEIVAGANRWSNGAADPGVPDHAETAADTADGSVPAGATAPGANAPAATAPSAESAFSSAVSNSVEPYTLSEAEEMLRVMQRLDPPGIAARDLRECLLLQLQDQGQEQTLTYRLVQDAFDDLIGHRWSDVAKRYGIDPRQVQDAADELSRLDPKPGLRFLPSDDAYVTPDLVVEKIEGQYRVFLNDTGMPRLRISRLYQELAADKKKFTGETREFVTEKLNGAQWLIQAIEQRRQTMLKVMNFIVDRQREFFEKGIEYLKPLTLREVADVINMHESTVSRVTNQKYVQTPRGVFPLKFFFSSSLETTSGEDASARAVRAQIEKLVGDENTGRPLTDAEIVQALQERGVRIARRTVAKYRDQLGILPARMRKRI